MSQPQIQKPVVPRYEVRNVFDLPIQLFPYTTGDDTGKERARENALDLTKKNPNAKAVYHIESDGLAQRIELG